MRSSICLILMLLSIPICGQSYPKLVIINKQHYFKRTVPKGNYSGITWLENNSYAIVSDKAEYSGFYLFSHPLKTIFQHKACTDKLYADSFYKVQKNSHSSFEVICCRR